MSFPQAWDRPLSLLEMPNGCRLCVEELVGSAPIRSKLYSMGIFPGTEMELCRGGHSAGSVCVRVKHCLLVLGEGLARAIYCRPADGRAPRRMRRDFGCDFERPRHGGGGVCHCVDITQPLRPGRDGDAARAKRDSDD